MTKKNNFLKLLSNWFFEEEEISEPEQDLIEINRWQGILILVITVGFIGYLLYADIKEKLTTEPSIQAIIKDKIEKNYFSNKSAIKNSSFSSGLLHWCTSDGGTLFTKSKSNTSIDKNEFKSSPGSLKIEMIHPSNRYYYTKDKKVKIVDNPYDFEDYKACSVWLGVLPNKNISASLWYKGSVLTFYLKGLQKDGVWISLDRVVGEETQQWEKLSMRTQIPKNIIAICIEITLNRDENDQLNPIVWIDDVSLTSE